MVVAMIGLPAILLTEEGAELCMRVVTGEWNESSLALVRRVQAVTAAIVHAF